MKAGYNAEEAVSGFIFLWEIDCWTLFLNGRRRKEMFPFWCSASEKQEVLNFLRQSCGSGRTGAWCPGVTGCWMQWHWQAPFGDFRVLPECRLCVPKSWVLGRKLRTSSFSPESHQNADLSSLRLVLAEFTLTDRDVRCWLSGRLRNVNLAVSFDYLNNDRFC